MAETGQKPTDNNDIKEDLDPRFVSLVYMLSSGAAQSMGIAPNPLTNELDKDMKLAAQIIETLSMLEGKTEGNLTKAEEILLSNALHELRMRYVEVSRTGETEGDEGNEPESNTSS